MSEYSKEELRELYNQLPEDLKKATFSKKIGRDIQDICSENGLTNNDIIFAITKNVGYVFLGLLSPHKFLSVLQTELKIKKAKEINSKIIEVIFLPLKKSLEILYQIKIEAIKTKKVKPKRKDKYRETIK